MAIHHVIIGGGPAATNAIETIRQFAPSDSHITLICDEPAHSRMALPYWLAKQIPREQTHTADAGYFSRLGVDARIGVRARTIDPQTQQVTLADDTVVAYDRLLIATGSSATRPPIQGVDLPGVQPLWTLDHTDALLQATEQLAEPRVALIGAGFIGFIMLNAMFKRGWNLTVVEREAHVLPKMLDAQSAWIVRSWLDHRGVQVFTGANVTEIHAGDGEMQIHLDHEVAVTADAVIVATGVQPNLALIDGSGIDTDFGILVDDHMQTNVANVYAAGDVAQGPVLGCNEREVHAIQPTAVDQGRIAGANMVGHAVSYPGSLLMNVVDVCGLQVASYGMWADHEDSTITSSAAGFVYRRYAWDGDRLAGAIFLGCANDMGMLTDLGMVKGMIQTQTELGPWKQFLQKQPFDVRRAYIGAGVAQQLTHSTLLGQPSRPREFRFGNPQPVRPAGAAHDLFVSAKKP